MTAEDEMELRRPVEFEPSHLHDDLQTEYFKIVDIVTSFDQRLLTVKGWGVTLSLASIGIGFQQGHYGLFLVAAVSGVAFWLIEGITKVHQMRYYPRMGDIEVAAFKLYHLDTPDGRVSSPLIDWAWETAGPRVRGGSPKGDPDEPQPWPKDAVSGKIIPRRSRSHPLVYPHVFFPHLVSVLVGSILFVVGISGHLGPI